MNKKRQTKLLAAITVLAMIVCAFAITAPAVDSEVSTDSVLTGAKEYKGYTSSSTFDLNRVVVDGTTVTASYESYGYTGALNELVVGNSDMSYLMNDFARFIGAIGWMSKTNNVDEIIYNDVAYKWCTDLTSKGSRWAVHTDETCTTLVSVVVADLKDQTSFDKMVAGETLDLKYVIDGTETAFTYGIAPMVATVNSGTSISYYNSLKDAWNAAVDAGVETVVTLLKNSSGAGLATWSNDTSANVTLDLNTYTYTCTGPAVGSSGTETQALHLEAGKIILKNGVLDAAPSGGARVYTMINNYGALTIDDVKIDASGCSDHASPNWALGLYNGVVNLVGNTSVIAGPGDDDLAFQTWGFADYTGVVINVELSEGGVIDGDMKVAYGLDENEAYTLTLNLISGTFTGDVIYKSHTDKTVNISEGLGVDVKVSDYAKNDGSDTITGTIAFGQNKVTFDGVDIAEEGLTLSEGSIVINGKIADTSTGVIEIDGNAKVTSDVNVASLKIVMKDNSTLTVPAGVALTVDSIQYEDPSIGSGSKVIVEGTLELKAESNNLGVPTQAVNGATITGADLVGDIVLEEVTVDKMFEFGDKLNTDYTVTTTEKLSSDLVIPEGKTLTINSTGDLLMNGHTIFVQGTLAVEYGGVIGDSLAGSEIVLLKGGVIANEGIIGADMGVTVTADNSGAPTDIQGTYTGSGSVTLRNVTGAEFALKNTTGTGSTVTYQLTVTGDIQAESGASIIYIGFNNVQIVGETTIGNDVVATVTTSALMGKADLIVNGILEVDTATDLVMKNNSAITVNGYITGSITAETGKFITSTGSVNGTTGFSATTKDSGSGATYSYITGYVLYVDSYDINEKDSDGVMKLFTYQNLYISGDLELATDATDATKVTGSVTFGTSAGYVAEDVVVTVPAGMTVTDIVVLGSVVKDVGSSSDVIENYIGTSYTVKVTSPKSETQYITTFENALAVIASADKQTVTVKGDLEIKAGFTVLEKQIVDLSKAGTVTISNEADIIVNKTGTIKGAIDKIAGSLKVYNGAKIDPLDLAEYAVKSTGTDDIGAYTVYAGLQYALDNAKAGDVIELVNATTIEEGDLVIPEGVTVIAKNTITVAKGDLVIENGAKLILEDAAGIAMNGAKAAIDVKGDLDMSESTGNVTFPNAANVKDVSFTSTGTTTLPSATKFTTLDGVTTINGVMYTNEDEEVIITNAEAAVAAAGAQDTKNTVTFYGTVAADDIAGVKDVNVDDAAKVTVKSLTLADGQALSIPAGAEFTGSVIVKTGVAGSETDSQIDLTKASNIVITAGKDVSTENVTTYEMQFSEVSDTTVSGKVVIAVGTVVLNDATTGYDVKFDGKDNSLTVASGATLEVQNNATLVAGTDGASPAGASVVIDGTLDVKKGGAVSVPADDILDIAGTMNVDPEAKPVSVAGTMNVTGAVNVLEKDGKSSKIDVAGVLNVGEKPTNLGAGASITGAVDITGAKYVKVYANADVSGAGINFDPATGESTAKSTAFYINNVLYMTVYAKDSASVTLASILTNKEFDIAGLDLKPATTYTNWYIDAELSETVDASKGNVGQVEELFFKANPAIVDGIKVSVGTGISLYIDGIKIDPMMYIGGFELPVGTHTVSAIVDPGYKGEPVVTFMGQEVNGTITITADMNAPTFDKSKLVISASGDITTDSQVVVNGGSEDGMSLTDILLIVLVVLILIMAIIVAMRLMRS